MVAIGDLSRCHGDLHSCSVSHYGDSLMINLWST